MNANALTALANQLTQQPLYQKYAALTPLARSLVVV
jgi:hypothetical protein